MPTEESKMVVTPWEVSGEIDYDRLIKEFGTLPISYEILERIRSKAGELHPQLARRVFFSHRDLDWILDMHDAGERIVLYTGRGPSGPVHIGHLIPWVFTKHLQGVFDAKLYFQMTDDEKFMIRQEFSIEDSMRWTYDNALDVIAVGFDPAKTFIISDFRNIDFLYRLSVKIAKHITLSTVKAVFGFEDSQNTGLAFFPSIQAAPAFLESELSGHNTPCLIPAAIDQDPYWRVTRDIAPKLGYYKPAQIHSRFLPGLGKGGKMSASDPESSIFTTDSPEIAARKIDNAFTGGRATEAEQRRLGANPDICTLYQYEYQLFAESAELLDIRRKCLAGELLCGEHKRALKEKIVRFLVDHQVKREKAKDRVEEFFIDAKGLSPP